MNSWSLAFGKECYSVNACERFVFGQGYIICKWKKPELRIKVFLNINPMYFLLHWHFKNLRIGRSSIKFSFSRQMGLHQTKKLLDSKVNSQQCEEMESEKSLHTIISDKELISKMHKELKQMNRKKTNNLI